MKNEMPALPPLPQGHFDWAGRGEWIEDPGSIVRRLQHDYRADRPEKPDRSEQCVLLAGLLKLCLGWLAICALAWALIGGFRLVDHLTEEDCPSGHYIGSQCIDDLGAVSDIGQVVREAEGVVGP